MTGYIHSTESFGSIDGPGIRYVVFMQGCPMRCLYCHNPDTWEIGSGTPVTAEEIIENYNKNLPFYKKGGITVTGGEPLLQIDFIIDLFKKAKSENIHTCLDTSGVTFNPQSTASFDELIKYTDLVMLDIKHIKDDNHKALTGHHNKNILSFARYLDKNNIPLWIRHIIVEGYTDNPEDLSELGEFIGTLNNLKALDVLPYHTMGVNKYKSLNIPYPLEGLNALSIEKAREAKAHILDGIRKVRS